MKEKFEGLKAFQLINYLGNVMQGNKSSLIRSGIQLNFAGHSTFGSGSTTSSRKSRTGGFGFLAPDGLSDTNSMDVS